MNELSQNAMQQMLNIEELNTGISNAVFFLARFFVCLFFVFYCKYLAPVSREYSKSSSYLNFFHRNIAVSVNGRNTYQTSFNF